jgi:Uma2 family endonuclease
MSVVHPQIRFSYEDYRSMAESMEKRYELLDGEMIVVPAPTTTHQFVSRNLEFILHAYVRQHDLGSILNSPVDVVFGQGQQREVVQPDVIFVGRDREAIITEAEIQGAPDLVIEVLSPGTEVRDRGYKRLLYGRHGVREYWIVDPEVQTIEVFRVTGSSFDCVRRAGLGDTLACALFPGLLIDLREVFTVR